MQANLKIRCQRMQWRDDIEFMVVVPRQDGGFDVGEPLTMRKVKDGEYAGDATFRLSNTAAQALIDELWSCGLRPSEGSGSAGSLAATERHLKDMRTIAMSFMRKDGIIKTDQNESGAP